jgi:hypothetical protein
MRQISYVFDITLCQFAICKMQDNVYNFSRLGAEILKWEWSADLFGVVLNGLKPSGNGSKFLGKIICIIVKETRTVD